MTKIYFAGMPIQEKQALEKIGIEPLSEGLSVSDDDMWEWIDTNGTAHLIIEREVLLTLSTSSFMGDEWQFCRIKFSDEKKYLYLSDSSLCADTCTIGGLGSNSVEDALVSFQRIVSWEESRIPDKILIHREFTVSSDKIISVYASLDYYKEKPLEFSEESKSCSIQTE